MVAECVVKFMDLTDNTLHEVGERFEVTEERFAEMNGTKYGQLVKAVEEQVEKPRRGRKKDDEGSVG